MFLDLLRNLRSVDATDPLLELDEGDFHPEFDEAFSDLESYITAPDDGRFFRRSLLHISHYLVHVGEEAQGEDASEVNAVDGGEDGLGTRSDDEAIVGVLELLACRK